MRRERRQHALPQLRLGVRRGQQQHALQHATHGHARSLGELGCRRRRVRLDATAGGRLQSGREHLVDEGAEAERGGEAQLLGVLVEKARQKFASDGNHLRGEEIGEAMNNRIPSNYEGCVFVKKKKNRRQRKKEPASGQYE